MEIIHGLLPGQVLQRDQKNKGAATVIGLADVEGLVELQVDGPKKSSSAGWAKVGSAAEGSFSASVNNLKTGGPYRLKFRIRQDGKTLAKTRVDDVFVGDVWILAGQSNMEGVGNLKDGPKPHPMVRAFFMRDEWGLAKEKLHFLEEAVDEVHNGYGDGPNRISPERLDTMRKNRIKGVGPGMAFGIEMHKRTKVPQGLIACAHGGTSMAQWSPERKGEGGKSLYGAMLRRYDKLGQPVAGVLWYQGESDANVEAAEVYTEKMKELVSATREDFSLPNLPWCVVQLGCHACATGEAEWNCVQEQQRLLPTVIDGLDVVPAIDLELDDGIHVSGKSQITLGKRLARAADRLAHGNTKAKPGIALKSVKLVPTPDCNAGANCWTVELAYANVVGQLRSKGRPTGFALMNANGQDVKGIYKTTLCGKKVQLHTNMTRFQLEDFSVSYGVGRYPYCNVTDDEDMSLPAIANLAVEPDHAKTFDAWQTAFLTDSQALSRIGYAKAKAAKGWRKAPPRGGFGVLPKPGDSSKVGTYAMRTYLKAKESLDALLIFGANAPFKIWLNGTALLDDSKCSPPLNPDQYRAQLNLQSGRNELLLVFAIPAPGAHIGIACRIASAEGKVEPRVSS